MEGLGDERFADLRSVGVGGVDQVHAELDGTAERGLGRLAIRAAHPRPRGP